MINHPTEIAGCILCLHPYELLEDYADGARIATWRDSSGQGNDATQGTANRRPVFEAAHADFGWPAVRTGLNLVGTDDCYMDLDDIFAGTVGATGAEIFAALKPDADPQSPDSTAGLWSFGGGTSQSWYRHPNGQVYLAFNATRIINNPGAGVTTGVHTLNAWSRTNDMGWAVNGTVRNSTASSAYSPTTTINRFGTNLVSATPTPYWNGRWFCIVAFDRKLTAGERADMVAWMAQFQGAYIPPPEPAVPANSTATVPSTGSPGAVTTITVQARDADGDATSIDGNDVVVTITGANPGSAVVVDNGDGTYTATYTPAAIGRDFVAITMDGTAISGSPYSTIVLGFAACAAPPATDWDGCPRDTPVAISSYADHVLGLGPLLYWRYEDLTLQDGVRDFSGFDRHGEWEDRVVQFSADESSHEVLNTRVWPRLRRPGIVACGKAAMGGAAVRKKSTDYYLGTGGHEQWMEDAYGFGYGGYVLTLWVRMGAVQVGAGKLDLAAGMFSAVGIEGSFPSSWYLLIRDGIVTGYQLYTPGNGYATVPHSLSQFPRLEAGGEYHIVYWLSGLSRTLWINGVVAGSGFGPGGFGPVANAHGNFAVNPAEDVTVDEVALFGGDVTGWNTSRASAMYQAGINVQCVEDWGSECAEAPETEWSNC